MATSSSSLHPWAEAYLARFQPSTLAEKDHTTERISSRPRELHTENAMWKASRLRLLTSLNVVSADLPTFAWHATTETFESAHAVNFPDVSSGASRDPHDDAQPSALTTKAPHGRATASAQLAALFHTAPPRSDQHAVATPPSPSAMVRALQQILHRDKARRLHAQQKAKGTPPAGPVCLSSVMLVETALWRTLEASLEAGAARERTPPEPGIDTSLSLDTSAGFFVDVLADAVVQRSLRALLWKRAADAHNHLVSSASPLLESLVSKSGPLADTNVSAATLTERLFAFRASDFYRVTDGSQEGGVPALSLTPVDHGGFFQLLSPNSSRPSAHEEVRRTEWGAALAQCMGRPRTDLLLLPSAASAPSRDAISAVDRLWWLLCDMAQLRLLLAYLLHVEVVARHACVATARPSSLSTAPATPTPSALSPSTAEDKALAATTVLLEAVAVLQSPSESLHTRRRHVARFLKKYTWEPTAAPRALPEIGEEDCVLSVQSFYTTFHTALVRASPLPVSTSPAPTTTEPQRGPSVTITVDGRLATVVCERSDAALPWPVALAAPSSASEAPRCSPRPVLSTVPIQSGAAMAQLQEASLRHTLRQFPTMVSANHVQVAGAPEPVEAVRRAVEQLFTGKSLKLVLRFR